MIIPKILPDELWLSYFIRLGKINGFKGEKSTLKHLNEAFGKSDNELPPVSILLARALQMSVKEFCRFHTLLPVSRAVAAGNTRHVIHGDELETTLLAYHARKLENRELKSCSSCILEDISYHGFSYFRREHQFLGFNFCSKHHVRLMRSSRYQYVSPEQITEVKHYEISADEIENQYVLRYKLIIDSWAGAVQPISMLSLTRLMQQKATALGLRWSKQGNKQLLSDNIFQKFPHSWLETIIPDTSKKVNGAYFATIDRLITPQRLASKSYYYALLLSALFESAEEALNASYEYIDDKKAAVVKRKKINSYGVVGGSKLDKLFIECNGLAISMANDMGVSGSSVSAFLIKNGLVPLGQYGKNVLLAFLDFQNGIGLMESSLKHGVAISEIEQMLRRVSTRQGAAVQAIIQKDQTANYITLVKPTRNLTKLFEVDPSIV